MSCGSLLLSTLGLAGSAVAVSCVLALDHARTAARYRSACKAALAGLPARCPQAVRTAEWIYAAGEDRSVETLPELVASLHSTQRETAKRWLPTTDPSRPDLPAARVDRRAFRQRGHLHLSLAQNLALIASGVTVAVGLLLWDRGPNILAAEQTVQDEVIALEGSAVAPVSSDTLQPVEVAVVAALQPVPMPSLAPAALR